MLKKNDVNPLLIVSLALLAASPPFSIDMYLPAFPLIADSLGTTPSMVQLTLSGFVLGLAVGQLVVGPISDAVGRKGLLLAGTIIGVCAAIVAACATNIGMLIAARVIQGLGLGGATVLSRAIIPDVASGTRAAKAFATMMALQTIAPVLAPVLGGVLVKPLGWRGLFWVLAGLAIVQLLATVFFIPETRPAHLRTSLSMRHIVENYREVAGDRGFRFYLLAVMAAFSSMFCYLSASSFFIQNERRLSVGIYTLVFAINSLGLLIGSIINARLIKNYDPRKIALVAAVVYVLAPIGLLGALLIDAGNALVITLLFLSVAPQSLIQANATSLGQLRVRKLSGSSSALMGFFQFGMAAVVGPLMGLGSQVGFTMALGMTVCSLVCAGSLFVATKYPIDG